MTQRLFETMVVSHYSMVIIFLGFSVVCAIALILEYKYLDLRKKYRNTKD